MHNSTLIEILRTLSQKEMKEFNDFICSPFFNKNANIIKLFNHLRKYHPAFSSKSIQKEYVYEKLFDREEYNDGFMRLIMYQLGKLAEDYLAYVHANKEPLKSAISLLSELNERKLEKIFLKYFDEIEKEIEDTEYKNKEFYFNKYLLYHEMEIYKDWSKFKHKDNLNYSENSEQYVEEYLSSYYIASALNHYRFVIAHKAYVRFEYSFELLEHIIDFLRNKKNSYVNEPVIKLHLYEVLMLTEGKDEHYTELKKMLYDPKLFGKSLRYSIHNLLQVHCVKKMYDGDESYVKERFELFKYAVENKIYTASEHIYFDDLLFANIAFNAASVGEIEWVENFINKYKEELSPNNEEVTVNISLARLYFIKKEYEKALECLNRIKTIKHLAFKFPVRDLTLIIYFELNMYNEAYYQLDSYRHFLSSNKKNLSESRFERLFNFIKIYKQLLRLKEKPESTDTYKLELELKNTTNVMERRWLAEKFSELTGKMQAKK